MASDQNTVYFEPEEGEPSSSILAAAVELFGRYGIHRVNIEEIAQRANLSRRTIYRYFPSRQALVEGALVAVTDAYLREAATRLSKYERLDDQLAELAVFTKQLQRPESLQSPEFSIFLGRDSSPMLWKFVTFLEPYIRAAQKRKEVRKDLNVAWAAEWVTRCLVSLWLPLSLVIDMTDFDQVRQFVRSHLVSGFR